MLREAVLRLRRWNVLALVPLAAAGCGGDGDEATGDNPRETTPATTVVTSPASARCVAAASDLMTPLGNGMKNSKHRLRNGQAVQSRDHERIYSVSAEIYGPGVDEGTIGTWATTSLGGAEAIWTVDAVSKQYSDLRDGTEVADLSINDDGAQQSRNCVAS